MIGVCLALLIDGSGSIPREEFRRMVEAHAAGLESPAVRRVAEQDGMAVSVRMIDAAVRPVLGWTAVRDAAGLAAVASAVRGVEWWAGQPTPIATAMRLVVDDGAPEGCERLVMDVATDGMPNSDGGLTVVGERDRAVAEGWTINAVVLDTTLGAENPVEWARAELVSPDGFVLEATGWDEWMRAIRRKLVLEVGLIVGEVE